MGSSETVIRHALIRAWPSSLPRNAPPIKLRIAKRFISWLLLVLGITAGCGDANAGVGTGGSGGRGCLRAVSR